MRQTVEFKGVESRTALTRVGGSGHVFNGCRGSVLEGKKSSGDLSLSNVNTLTTTELYIHLQQSSTLWFVLLLLLNTVRR